MRIGSYTQIIYWLPTPILVMVGGIIIWRKLLRRFPFFFTYLVTTCLRDVICLWAYHKSATTYFYTYWVSHLITTIFVFLATYELFVRRLFPGFYKSTFYRYLFSAAALVAIALGISGAVGALSLAALPNVINTLNLLRVLTLLFCVALMLFMGRQWHRHEFGIALGLAVDAAAFVITFAVFLKSGPLHGILRELPPIASDIVSVIWLITFLKPEKHESPPTTPTAQETINRARKWEQALKDSLTGKNSWCG